MGHPAPERGRASDEPRRAGRREWLGLAVLTLPTMLVMIDVAVLILAGPRLSAGIGADGTALLWITDIYGFMTAAFLVTMGRLADRIGHRTLLLVGAGAFGVLSLVAASATSPAMLIAARALLGVAGATIMPSTLALIRRMFPSPRQLATAMGIWSTAATVAISLGPVVGGALLGSFWWGSIFLIAEPVMLLLLVFGPFLLPGAGGTGHGRLDGTSVVLSLAAILPAIYGLKELARSGWAASPVLALALGAGCAVAFVLRQRRLPEPLLDLRLFRIRTVSGGLALYLLAGMVMGGNGLLVTQHLQLVEGFSPLETALVLLGPSAIPVVCIQFAMQLAKRVRPGRILVGGLLVAAAGMVVLAEVPAVRGLGLLIAGMCVVFVGVSPVAALSNNLVMEAGPKEKAGSVGSLCTTAGELGTTLGIACLGSLATVFYHGRVDVPAGTPEQVASAAGDNLAGAVSAAARLPGDVAGPLLAAARETFASAYGGVMAICAAAFVLLAAFTFFALQHVRPLGSPAPPAGESEPGQTGDSSLTVTEGVTNS